MLELLLCFVVVLFVFETVVLYFATLVKLLDYITLFTLVLLRPIEGVIFMCLVFITLFYPLSLCDKKGEVIFIFRPGLYF
jgi:hypothetical protein